MTLWVDADACPAVIKDILYRAAERVQTLLVLVANQPLRVPPSPWIRVVQVPRGFDVADDYIAGKVAPGDLVVTADIPLAAAIVARGVAALNPRGELYTEANIRELLDLRNFSEALRASGVATTGPKAFSHADRQAFANRLDRFLAARR